jgi:hypothetical protein
MRKTYKTKYKELLLEYEAMKDNYEFRTAEINAYDYALYKKMLYTETGVFDFLYHYGNDGIKDIVKRSKQDSEYLTKVISERVRKVSYPRLIYGKESIE